LNVKIKIVLKIKHPKSRITKSLTLSERYNSLSYHGSIYTHDSSLED